MTSAVAPAPSAPPRPAVAAFVLRGDLSADRPLAIRAGARIDGVLAAPSLTVAGSVSGAIECHGAVEILPGASVRADISGGSLQIVEGAVVSGFCQIGRSETQTEPALPVEPRRPPSTSGRWFWQK